MTCVNHHLDGETYKLDRRLHHLASCFTTRFPLASIPFSIDTMKPSSEYLNKAQQNMRKMILNIPRIWRLRNKVYSTSMAMLLTMVASIYLFSFKPTLQLIFSIVICIMSLHMHFAPPHTLVDLLVTNEARPKTLKQVVVEEKAES